MKHIRLSSQRIGLLIVSLWSMLACERGIQPQDSVQSPGARIRINQSITEVVVNSPDFTLLKTAVVKAGLAEALSTGNLTVFAPTDAAFRAAGFADVNAINNADVNLLKKILLYHVIGTERYFESSIPERLTGFTTLGGSQVYASRLGGLAVNGITVLQADLEATNGVIHSIDKVLLPPAGNTVEVAVSNPNLTYLVAALQRASQGEINLVQALASGTFTVFAPTNAAFQAAGFSTIASIQAVDPNVLGGILRYHVVGNRQFTTQFNEGELSTLQGNRLATTQTPVRSLVQGLGNLSPATVQNPDVVTINGVVHVIDQVLLPNGGNVTKSITDIVVDNPGFSLLKTAVVKTGLASALSTGNLTVFAPTDAAFRAAGFADANAINNADVNLLKKILLYHVIGDRYTTQNFSERLIGFTTLQGEQLQVVKRQSISVNGITVEQANIRATNGVIHVINKVLMPPTGNLVEVAVSNPNLSFLVAAVQRAGLSQALVSGTFTVFAPTNAAFQAAGFPTIASIQSADPAVLTRILTYHVVNGREFSSILRSGEVNTLQGGRVLVAARPGQMITIKGNGNASPSTVIAADVVAINAVVHVIDQVLLP